LGRGQRPWLFYAKLDNNGNKLIGDIVFDVGYTRRASFNLAIDSNDNVHLAWNDRGYTSAFEGYYMMLDGRDGSIRIDRTLISTDDGYDSKRQSILVDSEDKVHIIWKDQRGVDVQAVYYTKLDPSLDDQNGDPADESVITLIDDMPVSTNDSDYWVKNIGSAIYCGQYIYLSWWEDYDENEHSELYYMVLDNNGNTVVAETTLTTTGSVTSTASWTVPYLDVDSKGTAHIVWCDDRDGAYEVYYTGHAGGDLCKTFSVAESINQFRDMVVGYRSQMDEVSARLLEAKRALESRRFSEAESRLELAQDRQTEVESMVKEGLLQLTNQIDDLLAGENLERNKRLINANMQKCQQSCENAITHLEKTNEYMGLAKSDIQSRSAIRAAYRAMVEENRAAASLKTAEGYINRVESLCKRAGL
jgi:hypothetical protein